MVYLRSIGGTYATVDGKGRYFFCFDCYLFFIVTFAFFRKDTY